VRLVAPPHKAYSEGGLAALTDGPTHAGFGKMNAAVPRLREPDATQR